MMKFSSFGFLLCALALAACTSAPVVAPPPRIAVPAGPLTAQNVGAYMDAQENELRRSLHGAAIARIGDALVVTLAADKIFEGGALSDGGRTLLDRLAAILQRYAHSSIMVSGHTDTVGSPDANLALSQRRARLAADVLTAAGVPAARLQSQGLGDSQLRISTPANVGEPRNRRVEIRITPKPG